MGRYEPLFPELQREHSGEVLHDGMPEWLWSSFTQWLHIALSRGDDRPQATYLRQIERACRVGLDWSHREFSAWSDLQHLMASDGRLAQEVANYVLSTFESEPEKRRGVVSAMLEVALKESGSAWRVSTDGGVPHLEKRVPDEVRNRYLVASQKGRAGEHLRAAWEAMYGRSPDASDAYGEAVKAVEAAGARTMSPNSDRTTLGTMIRDFNAKPEKWNVPLGATPEQGRTVLLEMMKGVWHGQYDRHGTPDESRPIEVSSAESEAALHTAITLVHLLQADLVERVED